MMKNMICCIGIYLVMICTCWGQSFNYAKYKEKIYIHTSHVFFQPGQDLFFKLYLVNAQNQLPTAYSKIVFVEVLDPSGNQLKKLSYKVSDGFAEGSFSFDDNAPGGIYKLKAYTTWMRNESDSTFFVKELTLQKVIAPRVLMKLDFPKKGYGPGDEVVADYSIRNLSDKPISAYKVDYKVSLDGKVVATQQATTNEEGKVQLRFKLPPDLNTTDGLLNVTINYESYVEAISRSIPIVLNKVDLQLLPEGGTLVAGIAGNIAFRAVNEHGKPVDVKGEVLNRAGETVAAFQGYYAGMGQFNFTPQAGEKYTVKITSPLHIAQQYAFPEFTEEGVVMNVVKKKEKLLLHIAASRPQQVTLTGRTKEAVYSADRFALKRGIQTFEIDPAAFPAGIARFTLTNENEVPIAERLVFLNKQHTLQVKITPDKSTYLPREKVRLTLNTTDDKGVPLPSNLSLAVMDDKLWSFADDKQDHILSWLLMSSELSGKIEEPSFYFKQDEPKAEPALDLVMLTHGYRYFSYLPEVKEGTSLKYLPDDGYVLSGTILNKSEQPVKGTVFLVNMDEKSKAVQMTTGEDGQFFFADLDTRAHYYLIAKSATRKEKVNVRIAQNGLEHNDIRTKKILEESVSFKQYPGIKPEARKQEYAHVIQEIKNENAVQQRLEADQKKLEEVVVVGYGTQQKMMTAGSVVRVVDNVFAMAPQPIDQVLEGRMAGLQVTRWANPGAGEEIRVRGNASLTGNNQPLFIIDGVAYDGMMDDINPEDVSAIEVFKDAAGTALYGTRAANGVIVITTKKGNGAAMRVRLSKDYYHTTYVPVASSLYSVARKFYAPKYTTTDTRERNDFRETIYWNPVVQTDKTGTATLEFYNSDAATTFRAIAEGIAWNGKPGRTEATWSARSALQIDAKIPPYLSVGDRPQIPLVIKNNSAKEVALDIHVALPREMVKLGKDSYEDAVTLAANTSRQVLVPLEVIAAGADNIKFTVSGEVGTETLSLPIQAADKGFPVSKTISGDKSAQWTFNVGKPIDGSLKTDLRIFTSLEGQLLDGIESMLREPSGCFEQTSSATYPNIFILKYLRESGKSNPRVVAKAMDYIEKGYKRLISYETSENGFEWFGHAPAHEALTAYGLLEFTDMQSFIDVDKDMLARTKKFLLNRRDGKGGFKLASGGYDRFASVPNAIANLYIVYALTQAGAGSEIKPEYEAAVKKAEASEDMYQLGLMALAASNMKQEADYNRLLKLLKDSYGRKGINAATTVVNSRDVSLRVEALSLYALALAREQQPDVAAIGMVISKILSEKSYYGYGSTQATVLALNAIVEYVKIKGRSESAGTIEFMLNGTKISGNDCSAAVKEGTNKLTVSYSSDKSGIPYSLQLEYNTLQPPNSPDADLLLTTQLADTAAQLGETVRMKIEVKNKKNILQPMAIAKIGIPGGLSLQPWQLKELITNKKVAYYEIFDNYLVLYWLGFGDAETKTITLDLKADIPGTYKAKASNCYLYYTPEHKHWNGGTTITIRP
ncbi:MAG: TonB-dependent receptor plug domain-containing protein [Chitinophaga sp.]|uniref:TonB-dependent receptor plug domain-containing protein n=1 Tax=Chitinophaga sp. TaxID=1869181 RepID=UPI001B0A197D|nr:TonB-dependent receptor plug domain-containing protein [Chitinophaga sp.]MBO9730884.1 TonB-dependent receptor plug domain-containing protein [Chitinophaga sp.]